MIASSLYPHLEVHQTDDAVDVTLIGCSMLDEKCVETVREELLALTDTLPGRHVYLNLAQVEYMASAGLGLLLTLKRRMDSTGGNLTLCGARPMVYELFVVTRLTRHFHIV